MHVILAEEESIPRLALIGDEGDCVGDLRWTPLVRQLGWRVKRESRRIVAPYRCWPSG
jgi:hypothetical protein